ncbi:MAG: MarR family transcriptional regulator [Candidatus Thorarchaeota archaeon]|nr:MarR family transcriptional regulator [Candidatus Thorarchaeota archaeon]
MTMGEKVLQIATLGLYANERVDQVVLMKGADKLVLLYTEANKDDVVSFKERHAKAKHPIDAELVDPWGYESILATVLDIILRHKEYTVQFNISCGTIAMRAACHMAAVLIEAPVYFVAETERDAGRPLVEVQPLSLSKLTAPKRTILSNLIRLGGHVQSQKELADVEGAHPSSISKHLKELESQKYIRRSREGGKKTIEITELGKVILRLKDARRDRVWGG